MLLNRKHRIQFGLVLNLSRVVKIEFLELVFDVWNQPREVHLINYIQLQVFLGSKFLMCKVRYLGGGHNLAQSKI